VKLWRSTLVFSAMTFLSRISGYARDLVQSSVFGVSWKTDAFLIAYRIPNFLRRIFAEGSFAQAFVPVFTQMRQRGDDAAVKDLLDHVAGALCGVVLVVTAIGMLAAPLIAALFAPGSIDEPEKFELISSLLRITFPYLWFVSLTALAAGVLNSMHRFALPAVTPVLFNLAAIAAAIWLSPHLSVPIAALAWGVVGAGVLQLAVQWGALAKLGVLPRLRLNLKHEGVRRVFKLMIPTIFGSSVAQINLLVGTVFASLLATGSQTWLYLSDRLLEFPQGMFGVALGTVLLPTLARRFSADDHEGFSGTIDWGLRMALLVSVPASLGLFVLAEPINATLYQHGQFTAYDTHMAALSLAGLALGLPAFMIAKVLAPAFYARQDTRTPVRAAVFTVIVNVILCAAIVAPLWWYRIEGAHAGIALATALAGTVNAWLLWRYVRRQNLYTRKPGWARFVLRIAAASLAMIALLLAARQTVGPWSALTTTARVVHLTWTIASGAAIYGLVLVALGLRRHHLREH
jgi:putative peptidoglycan lipid II flippase